MTAQAGWNIGQRLARLSLAAAIVTGAGNWWASASAETRGQPAGADAQSDGAEVQRLSGAMRAFVEALKPEALAAGISPATFDRALGRIVPDGTILALLTRQPEHVLAPWDYMARLVSAKRLADGRRMIDLHGKTLQAVEASVGVDRHVVLAIWGVESSYGRLPGTRSVVRSLATLAVVDKRRPAFWKTELLTALKILDRGDITADAMVGSWAGAMGHTQFMPSSFMANAVDQDGDGRRDIWQSVPDALASTANYLKNAGWKQGEPWGTEVILPAGFDYRAASPRDRRSLAEWQAMGVTMPFGRAWPDGMGETALLMPTGMHGPTFLVGHNFKMILRYNNSISYALAVGHLSDRLAGRPEISSLWPTDDQPLAKPERRELQRRLTDLGHKLGPIDGVIGSGTRGAVRDWQRARGLPEDGWTGKRLLGLLRAVN